MSEPTVEPSLSRDARNSTYEPATDVEETTPPAGPQVIQTLGAPLEASRVKERTSKPSTTSSSS